MRLHVGCGSVYLDGYTNIDLPGPHVQLRETAPPALVEALRTTEDRYYARHEDMTIAKLREAAQRVPGVVDRYGNACELPFFANDASEILARQVFEHLSLTEAKQAMAEFRRVLAPRGLLRLDVPDTEETARLLSETKDPFFIRHLFGSRKDDYGYHLMGYTREGLTQLAWEHGFKFLCEEENIHYYPAFCLSFTKTP